ncbi:MAG: hypothetical protein HZC54_06465 [Verrucomicrobia bacterium]|nr:hypothetical protein [Verrucomicrobiota bacterium]
MADIPRSDDGLSRWLDQFLSAATDNATALGLSPAELTELGTKITNFKNGLANCTSKEAAAKAATSEKNNARTLILDMVRTLAKRFALLATYTDALGRLLGLIAPASGGGEGAPPPESKPVGKGRALRDFVGEISYEKDKGRAKAVSVYSRRGTETEFTLIGMDVHSPYLDNRAPLVPGKPETREYQLVYRDKNEQEYGVPSDIIVITCAA